MIDPNFTPFPVLTTERLTLRQTRPGDANEMFFLRSDEEVMKYIDRKPCETVEEAAAFIERLTDIRNNNDGVSWAITMTGDDRLIGSIGLWQMQKENSRAEIGYVLHPAWQGKGIMNEAMTAALSYAFDTIGLHSIEANTHSDNKASQKVLLKLGFVQEAYFKENFFFNGKFRDSTVFSMINPKH